MDPELLLSNLGFGGGIQSDDTLSRIPDRFLLNQSAAPGVDQYQLVVNHPELHHLLPVMGTSQLMQGSAHMMPETSHISTEKNQDLVDSASGNQEPRKGQLTSLDNFVEYDIDSDPDNENVNKDIPERFISGTENNPEIPNSSRILELCGIVPERYLIKSSKTKLGNSEVENMSTEGDRHGQVEKAEREANDAVSNNKECIPNDKYKSINENGSKGKYGKERFGVKDKVGSEKVVVEVEVHDMSSARLPLDDISEENCDMNERVKHHGEEENTTAEIKNDNKENCEPDEVRDKDDAEGLKSWSSTSSDSLYDPYTDLHLEENETIV